MNFSVLLVMFVWKLIVCRGDAEVSCVFMERCVLPCSFQVSTEVNIRWIHLTGLHVHSYYNNQDQFGDQDQSFRNRTSLFKDQLSRGNASLQLTGVKVQDEGRYSCFTSTIHGNKISIMNLQVHAPVHKVNIQQVENRITCSSEGIYPQPQLTWSTTPPSNISLHNTTTVQQNEQQLYSISSSLILADNCNDTDLVYSCTVSTPTNRRRAALRKLSTEVTCVFMERCILPCSYQGCTDAIIHWSHLKLGLLVHSYYDNQDQLTYQEQCFRNRTSLFKDKISRGNASLLLIGVTVQDKGTYQCCTGTMSENNNSFINLKVNAPVHKVNIQQVENRITCSSEGIYPQPQLTWSTTPPSNISLHNTTTVQQNEQQLYSISSSLILSHSHTDLVYSCTVSTPTNRRRAAWRKLTPISGSTSETIITCAASNFSFSHLVWRFNQRQMIMNRSSTDGSSTVSEEWRQQVKDVSESGDITLQDLSSHQEGVYTCEVSDAEETLLTDTSVKISGGKIIIPGIIVAGVLPVLIAIAAVTLLLYYKQLNGQQENNIRRLNNNEITLEAKYVGQHSAEETC